MKKIISTFAALLALGVFDSGFCSHWKESNQESSQPTFYSPPSSPSSSHSGSGSPLSDMFESFGSTRSSLPSFHSFTENELDRPMANDPAPVAPRYRRQPVRPMPGPGFSERSLPDPAPVARRRLAPDPALGLPRRQRVSMKRDLPPVKTADPAPYPKGYAPDPGNQRGDFLKHIQRMERARAMRSSVR